MPTYEYICRACNKTFERFQSITAEPVSECPNKRCKTKGKIERLLSTGGGFILKGSGFYKTDYRSRGYHEAKKKEEKPPCEQNKSCPQGGCCA